MEEVKEEIKAEVKVLEYTYALFLRCPKTAEVQHGTVIIRNEGFLSVWDLNQKMFQELKKPDSAFETNYTLIGMQIVGVEEIENV